MIFVITLSGCTQSSQEASLTPVNLPFDGTEIIEDVCNVVYVGGMNFEEAEFNVPEIDSNTETFEECMERIKRETDESWNQLFEEGWTALTTKSCQKIYYPDTNGADNTYSDKYIKAKNLDIVVRYKWRWNCDKVFVFDTNSEIQERYNTPSEEYRNSCLIKVISKDFFEVYKCKGNEMT